jgi:polysaccharide pyruvyl transferase WcaK-like protein
MLSVSKFTILNLRDAASYSRLSFIPEDRLRLTSDIAFLCPSLEVADQEYESWYKKQKQQQNRIVAVCPNAIQANRMGLDKYISDFGYLINKFEEQKHFSFLFLYHDLRPQCSGKNDENISHLLYNIFKGIAPCFFPSNINNGLQLKSYLQKIDFTIAGRMHFGIAGLSYKKPMYGIDYQDKFEGLLKFFDVNPDYYMVDYNKISSKEKNIEQFTDFLPLFELKIKEKLESVIMLCYKNV